MPTVFAMAGDDLRADKDVILTAMRLEPFMFQWAAAAITTRTAEDEILHPHWERGEAWERGKAVATGMAIAVRTAEGSVPA